MTEGNPPAIEERTFQRRRLAVLAGVLLVVLALAPFVAPAGDAEAPVEVAAGAPADEQRLRIAGVGSPTVVRELLSETATTLVEASGGETVEPAIAVPTTAAVAPSTTTAPDPIVEPDDAPSPTTTAAPAPTRSTSPAAEATTTTSAPPTTVAPTTAPPPSAASQPTTTTTAPASSSGAGYASDDPRGTQVWHDLAQCESGGNWSIDTGNGYYGGLQFSLATWESVGGTGYPHQHPVETQVEMGRRLQARQGWGAWPHCSEELGLR